MTLERVEVGAPRTYPPRVTEFTANFWNALEAGRFATSRCRSCARLSFPPKPICPQCWNAEIEWVEVAPQGILYAWTRIHAGPAIFDAERPYAVGIVDLAQGLRLACRLHGNHDWACAMPVRLIVLAYSDGPLFAATADAPGG